MDENDIQKIFTTAVRFLLNESKKTGVRISQVQLAKHLGVEPPSVSGYLNGHINYSETKRIQISEFFNRTYLEMLNLGNLLLNGEHPLEDTSGPLQVGPKKGETDSEDNERDVDPPRIDDIIRVYNNIMEQTQVDLDARQQEKLFNLIKRHLKAKAVDDAGKDLLEVIALTSSRQ